MTGQWVPVPPPKRTYAGATIPQLVLLGVAIVAIILVSLALMPRQSGTATGPRNVSGSFVSWTAVDTANGYANFTVTNRGAAPVEAHCTVSVRNDFGDHGFDIMVGESVAAGQTINRRMAISVGKGSLLINQGTVKDC